VESRLRTDLSSLVIGDADVFSASESRNRLALVSFGGDFDRTDIDRKVPSDVL
jgi:hypothetical protein